MALPSCHTAGGAGATTQPGCETPPRSCLLTENSDEKGKNSPRELQRRGTAEDEDGEGRPEPGLTRRGGKSGSGRKGTPMEQPEHSPRSHLPNTAARAEPRASPAAKKGKRKRGEEQEEKGRRVPGAGGSSNPPGSGAGRTRRALCGAGTRARGRGGPQRPPPGTERPLFPRTKGTAARGGWRMPRHGEPAHPPGLSTGLLSHAGMGCGRCRSAASQGRQRKSCQGSRQEGEGRRIRRGFVPFKCELEVTATQSRRHALPGGKIKSRQARTRQRDYTARERLLSGQGKGIN